MKISLLMIGDELLDGAILDTNSFFLSRQLFSKGFDVEEKLTCKDENIERALHGLLSLSDVVITSGGLGPTHDDKTVELIAKALRLEIVTSSDVKQDLQKRFPLGLTSLDNQSRIPKGAKPLLSREGTAPSWILEVEGKIIIALPGVPHECQDAFIHYVVPFLETKRKSKEKAFSRAIHFCHAREETFAKALDEIEKENPEIKCGIYPRIDTLSIVIRAKAKSESEFQKNVSPFLDKLRLMSPTSAFDSQTGLIEEAVHELLIEKKETLSVAESCTGGLITERLAAISGASSYLLAGIVTYSNEAKESLLKVSPTTLKNEGAVSLSAVNEMIEGLFSVTSSTYALAVSGIAGPTGGTKEKPVGLIYGAIAKRGEKTSSGIIPVRGGLSRSLYREKAASYLLGSLYRKLAYNLDPFSS